MKVIQCVIPLVAWLVCAMPAQAITLSVTSPADYALLDNITDAGTYYSNTQTMTGTSSLSVTGVTPSGVSGWKLYAKLDPAPSNSNISVSIRRTGSGSGGSISGGESYVQLSTAEVEVCTYTGTTDITSIPFEYQVGGIGVSSNLINVAKGTHTWKVKYRVVETTP